MDSVNTKLSEQRLDWTLKGIDPSLEGCSHAELSGRKRSLFDDKLFFPAAVLLEPVMRANSAWMRQFLKMSGLKIAPHGKTTMAPDLFKLQIDDGAWAITGATTHHVRCYREFGVQRIFLANPLVGSGSIEWVLDELKADAKFDFYCLIDSQENLQQLIIHARRANIGRPLQVLIEVGCAGGRCGVRNSQQGVRLMQAVASAQPWVKLVGMECFEGIVQPNDTGLDTVREMLDLVVELATIGAEQGIVEGPVLLSAGGSGFFDLVAQRFAAARSKFPVEVVIRSGCYLTHDDGFYARLFAAAKLRTPALSTIGYDLAPALQIWGQILSLPEPGRIICGVGKRDVGHDIDMPKIIGWARSGDEAPRVMPEGFVVKALNDQHAYIDGPVEPVFKIGDLLGFGVSHPCTTFDKWRALLLIDERYQLTGFVKTYF